MQGKADDPRITNDGGIRPMGRHIQQEISWARRMKHGSEIKNE